MSKTRILKSNPYKDTTLSSKVIHALASGKGITWLDEVRIPYITVTIGQKGRFPANLLVSDDILNDGKIYKVSGFKPTYKPTHKGNSFYNSKNINTSYAPSSQGSYSRYFDLDKWWEKVISDE